MKKFLNRAVAAIATGCFLMPPVSCVEDEKYYFLDASVHGKPEKNVVENLRELCEKTREYDLRVCEMMNDVKEYRREMFYNSFLNHFGRFIKPNDVVTMEVLACLTGMSYQDFREHIDKIGEELVGGILSQIFILKHGNSYKLKLFFRTRNTDSEKARVIPVTVLMDLFS